MGKSLFIEHMKATDVLGCVGSAIILLLASALIPLIGPFFSLLTPLPFLYYSSKLGLNQGAKIVALSVIIIGLITKLLGFSNILFLCIEFGLLGLIISEIFRRNISFGMAAFLATSMMLIIGSVIVIIVGLSKQMGPLELILEYFRANLKESLEVYGGMGANQERVLQLEQYITLLTNIIEKVYPALVIIGTGFVVWLNITLSRPLFRIKSLRYPDLGATDHWRAPDQMVWGLIASGFALFLPVPGIKFFAGNALIVITVIYVFHGLSILLFFLNKYRVPVWIRLGIYALIIFQQVFLVVLALAGLFDQWVDFRKIHIKKAAA